ncbi:MAG: hypothetical protein KAI17_01670 [Thiotrichaceae bacterium]|nr:hypothetical protein [Thiotrichaceae bacterium]
MKLLKMFIHKKVTCKAIQSVVITSAMLSGSMAAHAIDAVGYYSDNNSNRVFIVDPRNMSLVDVIPTHGDQPYPIDKVGNDKVYVSTRNSTSLDIIDYDGMDFSNAGIIPLKHKPRSVSYNSNTDMALVSGVRKALMSLIDVSSNTVVGVVGDPDEVGSGTITGHPFWVDDDEFLLTDRARQLVHLYKITMHGGGKKGKGGHVKIRLQDTIKTPGPVHHFSKIPGATSGRDSRTFYGAADGLGADGINPSVIEIRVPDFKSKIKVTGRAELAGDASVMGAHHFGMHPDGVHIYIGSKEGNTFIINRNSMSVINVIASGLGSGHTTFDAAANIAIETNHTDTFMTLIDTNNHVKLANIDNVANTPTDGYKSQSHTSSFDPMNSGMFYTAASQDGNLIEIDAISGNITNVLSLDTDGYIIQGTYDWFLGAEGSSGGDM